MSFRRYNLAMSRATAIDALIGRNVRALRAFHALGQEDLAGMMAAQHPTWTRQTVSEVERGRRGVLVSEVLTLTNVLDVELVRLVGLGQFIQKR